MKRSLLLAVLLILAAAAAEARDSYVLHFGAGNSTTISGSLEDFTAVKGTLSGDYLWVRREGRRYVITDRARLAEAWDYFAPERELRPQQREIERETRKLERESDALEDAQDDRELTDHERSRLDELHAQERDLGRRERALDEKEEQLDRAAERKLWQMVDRAIQDGVARPVR
jgi:Skp family chaperone for outer membrane proteins